jgi:hypothetical protein
VDKKQDEFKVKVDTKYGKYVKLGIAMLTTFGLIGTGAHQAGFFDIESEPILVFNSTYISQEASLSAYVTFLFLSIVLILF